MVKNKTPLPQWGAAFFYECKSYGLLNRFEEVFDLGAGVIAVELGDHIEGDALGADGLAFADVGATTEAFSVHGADHGEGAAVFLDLTLWEAVHVGDLGGGEEHGGSVGTGRYAGATADTGGGIHGGVGGLLGDGDGVRLHRAARAGSDETTGLDDAIQGGTIDHEVFNNGKGFGAPRLDGDGFTVLEMAHVQLAGGGLFFGTVGNAVDSERAHTANAFAAVVVKSEGFFALCNELLTEEVEHFEEGGILGDVIELVILEAALVEGALLSPDAEI